MYESMKCESKEGNENENITIRTENITIRTENITIRTENISDVNDNTENIGCMNIECENIVNGVTTDINGCGYFLC